MLIDLFYYEVSDWVIEIGELDWYARHNLSIICKTLIIMKILWNMHIL